MAIGQLAGHPNVPIDLDLVRYFIKLVLRGMGRYDWVERTETEVD